ncbi:MAG TPA: RDD family protein [Solirubrobacteraceae bacterium]|jgi:uncharacterized RDD family membrane protein YckC|nr:RDD family protein [Solirubrobacteraceae bacterium]
MTDAPIDRFRPVPRPDRSAPAPYPGSTPAAAPPATGGRFVPVDRTPVRAPAPDPRQQPGPPPLDPNAVVRARAVALVIDGLLVAPAIELLLWAFGLRPDGLRLDGLRTDGLRHDGLPSATYLIALLAAPFVYFVVCETLWGRTIGKRALGIRVVARDGSRARVGAIVVRNLLRYVDAVPLLYTSGLISMMRTGRGRRQRIGDVVAGTIVVAAPHVADKRTPGWLLPTATILSTLVAIAFTAGLFFDRSRLTAGHELATPNAIGFSDATSQAPRPGRWTAVGTTTVSVGYADDAPGSRIVRGWTIRRGCRAGACSYVLVRRFAEGPPAAGTLQPASDGWHVTFPPRSSQCGGSDRQPILWDQHSTMVLEFTDGGRSLRANERAISYEPRCGVGASRVSWTAARG